MLRIFTFLFLLLSFSVKSQHIAVNDHFIVLDEFQTLASGKTSNLIINIADVNFTEWRLTARVESESYWLNNRKDDIPAGYSSFIFNEKNSTVVSTVPLQSPPLGINEVNILESSSPIVGNVDLPFLFSVSGGSSFLSLDDGKYSGQIIFTLYDLSGGASNWESESTANFEIQISNKDNNTGNNSIILSAEASKVDFNYTVVNDLLIEKSKDILNGLQVRSNTSYEVRVRATNEVFVSAESDATIPISVLMVNSSSSSPDSNLGVTFHEISLSSEDQALIEASNPQKDMSYDLRYRIPPGNFSGSIPPGTYSGYLIFSLIQN